jgi:hypothetical protein
MRLVTIGDPGSLGTRRYLGCSPDEGHGQRPREQPQKDARRARRAAVWWPRTSRAQRQSPKLQRIGYLDTSSASIAGIRLDRLRAGLRDLGHEEGRNIVIEARWAESSYERLPGLAAELLEQKLDLIVAAGPAAIQVVRRPRRPCPSSSPRAAIRSRSDSSGACHGRAATSPACRASAPTSAPSTWSFSASRSDPLDGRGAGEPGHPGHPTT